MNDLKDFTRERIRHFEKYLKQNPECSYRKEIEDGIEELKGLL